MTRVLVVDDEPRIVSFVARALTADLLVGWGADRADVEVAASQVERLTALGPMAPPPE